MTKKILIAIFWLAFFGFFLYKMIPKYVYLTGGEQKHWGDGSAFDNSIFALHILAGILVYCAGILQFTPSIRNKYISFHRKTGSLYIFSSLLFITTLFVMIPRTWCNACRPSQFTIASL